MKRISVLAFFCLCCVTGAIRAQQYYFHNYSGEDGLSQLNVKVFHQDSDGYIWIGTEAGLNRFDGNVFQIFTNRQGLANDNINAISQDSAGKIWIGTMGGLSCWNGRFFVNYTTSDGLPDTQVTSLAVDEKGRIWCGTMRGLACREGTIFHNYSKAGFVPEVPVETLLIDHAKRLWAGTHEGLFYQDGDDFKPFPNKEIEGRKIDALAEDHEHSLWVASEGGLYRFQGTRRTAKYTSCGETSILRIFSICPGRDGSTWVGCRTGIFRIYDGEIRKISSFNGLHFPIVLDILKDREGIIWIGYAGGAAKFSGRAFTNYNSADGLGADNVRPILRDREGTLWVGTLEGLSKFDGETWRTIDIEEGASINSVHTLLEDNRGGIWIGTLDGLLYFDGETFHKEAFSGHLIDAIVETTDGTLWVSANGKGVFIRKGRGANGYQQVEVPGQRFLDAELLEDSKGNMWVTGDNGLSVWNGKTWKTFTVTDGLPSNDPYFMCEDRRGNIWFGYHSSRGLTCYNGTGFKTYTTEDGLFNDVVYSLGVDEYDNLWIGTARGVDKFDGKTFTNYGPAEGYASTESNAGGFLADHDGTLWFATAEGLSHYDPRYDVSSGVPPVVKLNSLIMGNEPVDIHGKITVPYSRNDLLARISCLSYINKKRLNFRYRLSGYDEHWKPLKEYRIIYTNLSPGDYRLEVQGRKYQYEWSEPASVVFTIRSPFWQTWWFQTLGSFFLVLAGISLYRLRVRHVRKREMELERLVNERTLQLKTANEAAQKERLAAEKANQAKSIFLARMSHEIRTPMNGIIGFTEMLSDSGLNREQADYAETIRRSGDALIAILNDILDFSKIEAGELVFEPIDFDPEVTAFDVCDIIVPRIGDKPVEILCHIGDSVPAYVYGDVGRLRQVLVNLMSNAAKFTETGEIELFLDAAEKEEEKLELYVKVRDTGVGIPEDKIDAIFDAFQQADDSITRKYGGTGLGLSICRQIARLMGGDIRVESEVGKGSTFHFTARVGKSKKSPGREVTRESLVGKKALVIDDNRSNLEILSHVLTLSGMRVVQLSSADAVLQVIRESFSRGEPFDICIIDVQMPGISGYDVAGQIRALDSSMSNLPLLAFSSSTTINQSRRYEESGFDGYLPKPIRREKLLTMMEHLLGKRETVKDDAGQRKLMTQHSILEETKHSVRILLAEDNPINQKLSRSMLTKAGYRLTMVENGKEAVEAYTAAPDAFDLILMDIQMPETDGREATREIRRFEMNEGRGMRDKQPTARHIPIIAMTAESMKGDREKCLEAGMNDYISKPVKREVVFAMVRKWYQPHAGVPIKSHAPAK